MNDANKTKLINEMLTIIKESADSDWKAAKWLLEHVEPETYSDVKSDKMIDNEETCDCVCHQEDAEDCECECHTDYSDFMAWEELISARLDNYERLMDLGVNVVWKDYDYEVIDDDSDEDEIPVIINTYIVSDGKRYLI